MGDRMIIEELELNQGKILIQKYISDDIKIIFNLLKKIVNISKEGKDLLSSGFDGAVRALNIPEYISEALFCLTLNPDRYVRFLKKFNGSIEKTDIFDLKEEKGIELKTKNSKEPSPSSFSPKEIKTACYGHI